MPLREYVRTIREALKGFPEEWVTDQILILLELRGRL